MFVQPSSSSSQTHFAVHASIPDSIQAIAVEINRYLPTKYNRVEADVLAAWLATAIRVGIATPPGGAPAAAVDFGLEPVVRGFQSWRGDVLLAMEAADFRVWLNDMLYKLANHQALVNAGVQRIGSSGEALMVEIVVGEARRRLGAFAEAYREDCSYRARVTNAWLAMQDGTGDRDEYLFRIEDLIVHQRGRRTQIVA